ncbi:MAG: hypothetical protein WC496_01365 [Phycisphaerae bacterium]|jgi:hypothetical protein
MRKRNWLVEDNIVALYIALHHYKDLKYDIDNIRELIPHKGFPMRIQNYKAIHTKGEKGLNAGLKSPLFNELYDIFNGLEREKLAKLVNSILKVKSKITI